LWFVDAAPDDHVERRGGRFAHIHRILPRLVKVRDIKQDILIGQRQGVHVIPAVPRGRRWQRRPVRGRHRIRFPVGLLMGVLYTSDVRDPIALLRVLVGYVPSPDDDTVAMDTAIARHPRVAGKRGVEKKNQ